jgi:hypothetical protein
MPFCFFNSLWKWCSAAVNLTPETNPRLSHTLIIIQETLCVGTLSSQMQNIRVESMFQHGDSAALMLFMSEVHV